MTRQQPPLDPERVHKAVRARALTNPRGAMGFSQARERIERERRARQAVFLTALTAFVGSFVGIMLRDGTGDPSIAVAESGSPSAVMASGAPRTPGSPGLALPGPDRPTIPLPGNAVASNGTTASGVATEPTPIPPQPVRAAAAEPKMTPPRPQVAVSRPARKSHARTKSS